MDKPLFHIEMKGAGVCPQTTPLKSLVDFLTNLEATILETAKAQNVATKADEAPLSLVEIATGSNRLGLAVSPVFVPVIAEITCAINTQNFSAIPDRAHRSLYEIYEQAKIENWEVHFVEDKSLAIEMATLSNKRPIPNPASPYVQGSSTIFGTCIRVGGAEPKVDIRLPNRARLLHVEVTEEMARSLARNLYDSIAMTGEATWESETWSIVNFKATSVVNIQSGSPLRAFEELGEVVGEKWKDIDVDRFVEKLRSGKEAQNGEDRRL